MILIANPGLFLSRIVIAALLANVSAAAANEERQRASASKSASAIARQGASVRRQSRTGAPPSDFFILGWRPRGRSPSRPPIKADCAALSEEGLMALIAPAASEHNLDPLLLRAVIDQESGGRPCAVSSAGAQGLMQIMPGTSRELGLENPFEPAQNVRVGARYLRQLLDRYAGSLPLALAAYNAGPGRVEDKIPDIAETREYVASILEQLESVTTAASDTPR